MPSWSLASLRGLDVDTQEVLFEVVSASQGQTFRLTGLDHDAYDHFQKAAYFEVVRSLQR